MVGNSKQPVWLAIRLPALPLEVFGFSKNQPDTVLVCEKQSVVCATRQARDNGVKEGMPASTAQLLVDGIVQERDRHLERCALQQLTRLLYQFSPHIQPLPPGTNKDAGLLVEVSRSLTLFGGLPALNSQLRDKLTKNTHSFVMASAHTGPCAWLLSWHESPDINTVNASDCLVRLAPLPVQLLGRCHWDAISPAKMQRHIADLEKSGFVTMADITRQISKQSTAGLRKRWGNEFTDFITAILGIDHQLQQPTLFQPVLPQYHPEQFFYDSLQFEYPVKLVEQLLQPMTHLLQNLHHYLLTKQRQSQSIEWLLFDIYQNKQTVQVFTSQQHAGWQLFLELSRIQLEAGSLGFEVDSIELICRNTSKQIPQSEKLPFDIHQQDSRKLAEDYAIVTAKLKARLGERALFNIRQANNHIPELSSKKIPLSENTLTTINTEQHLPARPSWLFEIPNPIREQQQNLFWRGKIELLQGPERVQGNWWQKQTARDYFIARREDGLRLWVFYDLLKKQWFTQGIFA